MCELFYLQPLSMRHYVGMFELQTQLLLGLSGEIRSNIKELRDLE